MNQSTSNTKQALEGAANGETVAKAAPQRRYRRSSHTKSVAAQPETAASPTPTTPTEAPLNRPSKSTGSAPPSSPRATASTKAKAANSKVAVPLGETQPQTPSVSSLPGVVSAPTGVAPAAAAAAAATSSGAATATASGPSQHSRTRNQRNNGRRNKGDVHLVVPSTPELAETTGVVPAAAATSVTNPSAVTPEVEGPEISSTTFVLPTPVPVLTKPAISNEAAIPPVQEHEREQRISTTEPASSTRRYRFDRHSTDKSTLTPPPAVRPERLSGPRNVAPAAEISAPEPARNEAVETTEEPFNLFAPRPSSPHTHTASDDILSELGLREARNEARNQAASASSAEEISDHYGATPSDEAKEGNDQAEELPATSTGEVDSGTGTRRRRRRRRNPSHAITPEAAETSEASEIPETLEIPDTSWPSTPPPAPSMQHAREASRSSTTRPYMDRTGSEQYDGSNAGPFEQPYSTYARSPQEHAATKQVPPPTRPAAQEQPAWDIASAQQYIRQEDSPFGAPAPSFARGFGPQPRGVANQARDLYTARPARTERGTDTPPLSSNQLANIVSMAIAQQTDRLLTEMRHEQHPPSMTVMFPSVPSTERVGIFVDVANLLYSSRSLRITIDFGRLLEFLRGNRRLIRAHAYAPTNPDPGADQSFLTAVKGMGYRITTKNYKTFSSGAKKADMDLDLCMDIVRLVDSGALDTVVLVSGDSDFLPLLEYCSDHGVRVEAAAFDDSAAMILRQSCDLFINLTLATDIRV